MKAGESAGEFPNRSPECASSAAYGRDMAKKHIMQTIDDLDGSVIEDGTTVTFSLEGRSYEIDLASDNADKLRDAFGPYITAARPVGSSPSPPRCTPRGRAIPTRDVIDVRSWTQKMVSRSLIADAFPPLSWRHPTPRIKPPNAKNRMPRRGGIRFFFSSGQTSAVRPAPAASRSAASPSAAASGVTPRFAASSKTRRTVSPMPATRRMMSSRLPRSFATRSR